MNMKKITAWILGILLCFGVTGCGGKNDTEKHVASSSKIIGSSSEVNENKDYATAEEYFANAEFTPWEECLTYEFEEGGYTITDCSTAAINVHIPDEIEGKPVLQIGKDAFEDCRKLKGVIIGNNVQSISHDAFIFTDLEYVIIPDSVTEIGISVFDYTPLYEKYEEGVVYVDGWAVGCASDMTEVIIEDGTRGIAERIFRDCESIESITINDLKNITESLFLGCSTLKTVVLGDGVETIGANAFKDCTSLSSVTLGKNINKIGKDAFNGDYSLNEIILPESVTGIGEGAFQNCRFSSIIIPEKVEYISRGAFDSCSNLESITIENPECEIYDQTRVDTIPSDTMIYGYWGSTAEQFANDWYMEFTGLDDGNRNNAEIAENALKVTNAALGSGFSAAITEDGSLYTWGDNEGGQLGQGDKSDPNKIPEKILDNIKFLDISSGSSAAITDNGELYMWGANGDNQLAMKKGKLGSSCITPTVIMENVINASVGNSRGAAVTEEGILWTWGNGYPDPKKYTSGVRAVSVGERHIVYITENNELYVFGCNDLGQYGNGTVDESESRYVDFNMNEVFVMGDVIEASAGYDFTAAVTADGSLYTWGSNKMGQLGNGNREDSNIPVKIMDNVKTVSVNGYNMIVLSNSGEVYVFKRQEQTEGDVPVKMMDNAVSVSCGSGHYAAVSKNGKLFMWGNNDTGQLGDGTTNDSEEPIEVYITENNTLQN